jgi:hypothetical protein
MQVVLIGKILFTPYGPYYVSLEWMYLNTKICLDTFKLAINNMNQRE